MIRICLNHTSYCKERQTIKALRIISFVTPSVLYKRWTGILTSYPSVAAFAITLGSPNPPSIFVAEETLDLRGSRFSRDLRLLMPTFSLPCAPAALTDQPSVHKECSPTTFYINVKNPRLRYLT